MSEEPQVKLREWDIKKDTAGNAYFIGTREDDGFGRVSTPIVEFDPELRRGRTKSGRIYELVGPGGNCVDAEFVWALYKVQSGIVEADQ